MRLSMPHLAKRQVRYDERTTLGTLKHEVERFVAEREWEQFHSPKNLAMAIGVEAGELMDLFRWHSEADGRKVMKNGAVRKAAIEELADVVICALIAVHSCAHESIVSPVRRVHCDWGF
jgi:NTP pyrophosphatase (non-canonical NTP hydrolase)